jgi:hypothetical protein
MRCSHAYEQGVAKSTCMNSMFRADKDYAVCNIQNRSIAVEQLTQLRKLSKKNLLGHWCSQKLTVMPSASGQSGSTTVELLG